MDAKAQKSARTGRRRVLKLGAAGILAWTMPVPGAVARGVPPPVPVGRGLVDGSGRVHSVPNLYLGGSSTFATGSWINPTYTIVQLSLRLGDHLGARRKA